MKHVKKVIEEIFKRKILIPEVDFDKEVLETRLEKMTYPQLVRESGVDSADVIKYNYTRDELITQALKRKPQTTF